MDAVFMILIPTISVGLVMLMHAAVNIRDLRHQVSRVEARLDHVQYLATGELPAIIHCVAPGHLPNWATRAMAEMRKGETP